MSNIIKSFAQNENPIKNGELPYKIKAPSEIRNESYKTLPEKEKMQVQVDIIEQAQIQARKIIDQAQNYSMYFMKSTADRVKAEFDEKIEKRQKRLVSEREKKGYEDGFQKGYQDGMDQADVEYEKTIKFLQGVVEGIDDGKQSLLVRYEDDLKEVALTIARLILKHEVEQNPKTMRSLIQTAASQCKNQDYLRITVSPNCKKLLNGEDYDIGKELSSVCDDVKVAVDGLMQDGDCIIETPDGIIDCGINTQLNNTEVAFNEMASE